MPISERAPALLLLLGLAACGRGGGGAPAPAKVPGATVIGCALARGAALAPDCTVERSDTPAGVALVLRQPDGGFRRLLVTADGRGVVAADGAERATVRIVGAREIEVAVADERYRLPATLRGAR